jgi:hypothetical protein
LTKIALLTILGNIDNEAVIIKIPLDENSTSNDIRKYALEIADKFIKQQMTWVRYYSIEELRTINGIDPSNESWDIKKFIENGFYYDSHNKVFFDNEEQFNKANEVVE